MHPRVPTSMSYLTLSTRSVPKYNKGTGIEKTRTELSVSEIVRERKRNHHSFHNLVHEKPKVGEKSSSTRPEDAKYSENRLQHDSGFRFASLTSSQAANDKGATGRTNLTTKTGRTNTLPVVNICASSHTSVVKQEPSLCEMTSTISHQLHQQLIQVLLHVASRIMLSASSASSTRATVLHLPQEPAGSLACHRLHLPQSYKLFGVKRQAIGR